MRVRNRRTGKWITLPDDDGLVALGNDRYLPEQIQQAFANQYLMHDMLSPSLRYCFCYPTGEHDATTPTLDEFTQ